MKIASSDSPSYECRPVIQVQMYCNLIEGLIEDLIEGLHFRLVRLITQKFLPSLTPNTFDYPVRNNELPVFERKSFIERLILIDEMKLSPAR